VLAPDTPRLALEMHFGKKCASFDHLGGLMVIYASASFVHSVHLDAQLRPLCGPVRLCLESEFDSWALNRDFTIEELMEAMIPNCACASETN